MTATDNKHREIHRLAGAMIDLAPRATLDPDVRAAMLRTLEHEVEHRSLVDALGVAAAMRKGQATVATYERGPESALMHAALVDVVFGRTRERLRWCEHRTGPTDGRLTFVSAPLRFAACAECADAENAAQAVRLDADNACDVCGTDHGAVTPRIMQLGALMIALFTGPCCDELFTYREPIASHTYRRVGRNESCPCGSGRKLKHCCGSAVTR